MNTKTVRKSILSFTAIGAGVLALSGCITTQQPNSGKIYVDRPEVFSRERLINRRLEERKWLENQLGNDAEFSLQGSREVREFTGFALALKGQFDPLGGAQAESLLTDVKGNSRIGELQDELQVEVLRQQLDSLRSSTNPIPLMPGQITATNPPTLPTNITNPLPAASAVINVNNFATSNLPVLPSTANRSKTTAQLTSIQTLDDKLAYRNAIQARLREQELDDTHDLQGMTLYTLKFDMTVAPGSDNSSLGELKISVLTTNDTLSGRDYTNWVASLNRELRDESVGLQRRYRMGLLTDEEEFQLMTLALRQNTEPERLVLEAPTPREIQLEFGFMEQLRPRNLQIEKALKILSDPDASPTNKEPALEFVSLQRLLDELNSGIPGSAGCQGLAFIVRDRYQRALEDLVTLVTPVNGVAVGNNVFYFVAAKISDSRQFSNFTNLMSEVTKSTAPYIYTVEPKEYAQNISDIAAREKLINYSLALSAAIPQAGASLSANMDYIRRSQTLLEAIKRRPLVVGFVDGATNFGWVVGPKFEIENGEVCFSHTHVQHSVQATVVVPAWWSSLTLTQSYSWLQKDGKPYTTQSAGYIPPVTLPRDYAAITRALLARADESLNKPSILPRWNDGGNNRGQITLREGNDETLLIRGRGLWRNPEVYIGGQQASDVRVLPDMAGLRADFKSIRLPSSEKREAQAVDLTIVTSAGAAVLRDGVRLLPSGGTPGEPEKFTRLHNNFVVLNSNLVFAVDARLLPQSFAELVLRVSDKNQEQIASYTIPGNNPPQSPEWQVPFIPKYIERLSTQTSQEIWIELGLRANPDPTLALTTVLADAPRPLVLFTSVSESQFDLNTNSITIPPNSNEAQVKIRVATPPELFLKAWPGLKDAITSGTASLAFGRDGTNAFAIAIERQEPTLNPLSVSFSADQVSLLKETGTNAFTLKVRAGEFEVPVRGKLTILRPKP